MQFRDLKRQYQNLKSDIDAAMIDVASSSSYIMGSQVKDLENQLAEYVGVKHCLSCANGTDALSIALKVWEIGEGDAVFVPDFTFFSSAEVISAEGAVPVFVDVDSRTYNIDTDRLEIAIRNTIKEGIYTPKAIISVDLFGLPADYPAIRKITDKYGLKILEDSAQGFGGRIGDRKDCSFGDIATTSFFPAKPLGCYGDGGALFTDNQDWADLIESIRVHGKGDYKYDNVRIGMNSRLDTIQAAILQVKFKAFVDYELESVNRIAALYTSALKECDDVILPLVPDNYYSSWAQYTIQLSSKEVRDKLQSFFKSSSIPSMIYYPKPMHAQTVYKNLGYSDSVFPISSRLCDTVLSLPIHPYMECDEVSEVCNDIKRFFKGEN